MIDSNFIIRRAGPADAPTIAWHRARMFQDMGEAPPAIFEDLRAGTENWIARALQNGEYVGWLAAAVDAPHKIVAGAGAQVRQTAPHPRKVADGSIVIALGRQAVVVNVFTEPEWRRHGLAKGLMEEILTWARAEKLDRLVLHASVHGRALYEQLGFAPTNEMRFSGDLAR